MEDESMIYLDNAATTKISTEVLDEMMPYLTEEYGNPGTIYRLGRKAADAISQARQRVADFIGASPEQIIFTSGGSEANTIAIRRTQNYLKSIGKEIVLINSTEHDSIIKATKEIKSMVVGVNKLGIVDINQVEEILKTNHDIGLVSIMYTNNETGSVNPIIDIARICSKHNVLFHTDCVQAAGCQLIDVGEIGCDFLSLSSHKIHGCKGVGALFVKNKELLTPQIYGGASQEFGIRSGTENVAGIVGFGKACEIARLGRQECLETVTYYRRMFYEVLTKELCEYGINKKISINGESLSNQGKGKILNLRIDNVDAETLMLMLDMRGVCISAGSACRSHESHPSHVLIAMGLTPEQARDSIRISFSEYNKEREIDAAARIVAKCIKIIDDRRRFG